VNELLSSIKEHRSSDFRMLLTSDSQMEIICFLYSFDRQAWRCSVGIELISTIF